MEKFRIIDIGTLEIRRIGDSIQFSTTPDHQEVKAELNKENALRIADKLRAWANDETSQDRALNLADVIARYSLPEDFEERLARYLELACNLKEDGLQREEYDEYCELEEEIKDEYF